MPVIGISCAGPSGDVARSTICSYRELYYMIVHSGIVILMSIGSGVTKQMHKPEPKTRILTFVSTHDAYGLASYSVVKAMTTLPDGRMARRERRGVVPISYLPLMDVWAHGRAPMGTWHLASNGKQVCIDSGRLTFDRPYRTRLILCPRASTRASSVASIWWGLLLSENKR
eukprot:scaffold201823_cov37-Tisochrysis_lutea.AAC.1